MNFLTVGIPPSVLKNRTVRYACSFYVIRFSLPCGKDTENLLAGKSDLIKNMYLCRRIAKRLTVEVTYLISGNREYRFFCYVWYR